MEPSASETKRRYKNKCAFSGCNKNNNTVSLFKFPVKDKIRLAVWIKNSGNPRLKALNDRQLRNHFLCQEHFGGKYLLHRHKKNILTRTAIPYPFKQDDLNSQEVLKVKYPIKVYERAKKISENHSKMNPIKMVKGMDDVQEIARKKIKIEAACPDPELDEDMITSKVEYEENTQNLSQISEEAEQSADSTHLNVNMQDSKLRLNSEIDEHFLIESKFECEDNPVSNPHNYHNVTIKDELFSGDESEEEENKVDITQHNFYIGFQGIENDSAAKKSEDEMELEDEKEDDLEADDEALFPEDCNARSFRWKPGNSFEGTREQFIGADSGSVEEYATPYDAFRAIWTAVIMEHIAKETNRYVEEKLPAASVTPENVNRNEAPWKEASVDDIWCLFGAFIVMSFATLPSYDDYWTYDVHGYSVFPHFFSRERFAQLLKYLHFQNNNTEQDYKANPENNKSLFRIWPILSHLTTQFQRLYTLGQNIYIDESLVLCRRERLPTVGTNTLRKGIKYFELCDSQTAYVYNILLYMGKETSRLVSKAVPSQCTKATSFAIYLVKDLLNKGYTLFLNDWFTTPLLARYLKRNGLDCVGNLRTDRSKVSHAIENVDLKPGQYTCRHAGDISTYSFMGKKKVSLLSTYHKCKFSTNPTERKPVGQTKPDVKRDFHTNMNGVKEKDQISQQLMFENKRSKKLDMALFHRLLNVSVRNARVLYNRGKANRVTAAKFKKLLVLQIRLHHSSERSKLSERSIPGVHRIVKSDGRPMVRESCVWCLSQKVQAYRCRTNYTCNDCKVVLHPECYHHYHA